MVVKKRKVNPNQIVSIIRKTAKLFCAEHGITNKQYRKFIRKSHRGSEIGELYLNRISKKEQEKCKSKN